MGLGARSLAADLGLVVRLVIQTDSSAARAIAKRKGLGKTRHLAVCHLWLQDRVGEKEIEVQKIGTHSNAADLMTKHLDAEKLDRFLSELCHEVREGRHHLAPKVG